MLALKKVCKTCGEEKPLSEYYKAGKWYHSYCRICVIENSHEWAKNNRGKRRIICEKYVKNNLEKDHISKLKWAEENREYNRMRGKIYSKNNPEKRRIRMAKWRKENPDKVKEICKKRYQMNKTNLQYQLNKRIRERIRQSLKGNKNGRHWESLTNYTIEQLITRLTSTLPNGYDWQDYLEGKLHIDHIIPISAFNFSSPEHIDFQKCWALDNLQLLPAYENMSKSNKLKQSFQPSLSF